MSDFQPREPSIEPLVADGQFRAALDAMIDQVAIGMPVRDGDGTITDFVLVFMNAASVDGAGRGGEELVGGRVCELWPEWRSTGMFDRFRSVVETGAPYVADRLPYRGETPEGAPIDGWWRLSVVRFGDGYLAVSRDVTALVLDEQDRLAAEHEAELEAQRSAMAVELLQRAAMPARLPEVAGAALGACYEPAAAAQPVGGDWYDAFPLGSGRLGIVIADVAGHGPEAAGFMVQVRNVVRALAIEHAAPSRVLGMANRVVASLDEQHLFATCCYGVLDGATGSFSWASAGHLTPLLLGPTPRFLATTVGPPLGVELEAAYQEDDVVLAPSDRVLLFTDGLVEERGQAIGASLAALLAKAPTWDGLDAQATVDAVAAAVEGHADDLALICVQLVG